jgi:hypothetical protein
MISWIPYGNSCPISQISLWESIFLVAFQNATKNRNSAMAFKKVINIITLLKNIVAL